MRRRATAQETDIVDRLKAVPGLTVVGELPTAVPGYRFFALTFRQPADHQRPWLGSFEQRLRLMYRGTDRPTLLHTGGYGVRTAATLTEVARAASAAISSTSSTASSRRRGRTRRTGRSSRSGRRPRTTTGSSRRWSRSSRSAGCPRAPARAGWRRSTTGASIPMTSTASVAYVAAQRRRVSGRTGSTTASSSRSATIPRASSACRRCSTRRSGRAGRRCWPASRPGRRRTGRRSITTLGTADRTFEFTGARHGVDVLAEHRADRVPDGARALGVHGRAVHVHRQRDRLGRLHGPEQRVLPPVLLPGGDASSAIPRWRSGSLRKVRRYPDLYQAALVRRRASRSARTRGRSPRSTSWARWFGSELLFVYGENDPWGAERFAPARWTRDTHVYEVAGGTHTANITQLPQAEDDQATATVRRCGRESTLGAACAAHRSASGGP